MHACCRTTRCSNDEACMYLGIHELSPETSGSTVGGVAGEEGRPVEGLVDVLHDDEGLADGAVAVHEHGHLLVDGVVLQQQLALVFHVFLDELVRNSLEAQGGLSAVHEWAAEERADELNRWKHLNLLEVVCA